MSDLLRYMIATVVVALVSAILSLIWWVGWQEMGLIGPLPLLHWLPAAKSEPGWLVACEMFVNLFVVFMTYYTILCIYNRDS